MRGKISKVARHPARSYLFGMQELAILNKSTY